MSAAAAATRSRSASAVCAKAAKGFHVFRIDGYSLTAEALPGGERVSSKDFAVGGHRWRVDLYPNGADGATKDDAASISLFVRRRIGYGRRSRRRRVRAQCQFSLLNAAGRAAYSRPAATGVFASRSGDSDEEVGCGYLIIARLAAFVGAAASTISDDVSSAAAATSIAAADNNSTSSANATKDGAPLLLSTVTIANARLFISL
ncbi:hypothetical protein EJB05_57520, partial [Eragrostis curvula]